MHLLPSNEKKFYILFKDKRKNSNFENWEYVIKENMYKANI